MPLALGETATGLERTPVGRRLVVKRAVEAPPESVWDVLTDTEQWPAWGPSISAVDSTDRYIERGSTGRVRLLDAVWLPYEITSCADCRWTWDVARVDATGHFVSRHPDGAVVGFELPVLAAGYVPVCRRACGKIGRLASRGRD
jgi:hypothetical protein